MSVCDSFPTMNKFLILALFVLASSCAKKSSPVVGEPHQKEIEASFSLFESGKLLQAAAPGSPYFEAIAACALQKEGDDCTPRSVPLLGMRDAVIDADYVLKNTIVSHDFLARNFKQYLNSVNNKYLFALFGSVSGIVITDEISSSFYYSPTGMIYINASYLWKTQEEFSKLKFKKDGRFSRDERKKILTDIDYVKDNKIIYDEARKKERELIDIAPDLSRLFFHELTHANDIYPADQFEKLDQDENYYKLRTKRYEAKEMVSRMIVYPETKKAWEYAVFVVDGELINPDSHLFTKEDFISDFAPNIGMVFYSYLTNREHLAMMMESYFMLFTEHYETCTYGKYRESTDKRSELFWFQKNRILQDNILAEARGAIDLMLPSSLALELNSMVPVYALETIGNISPDEEKPTCKNY